ncbi:Regulatory protein afsR [Actinoplanes sp. SE50]|uniref:hypothetical protein n=1 Tax=unclassified Actinoplanes TaxID=2626549 RepID=UPI00023ECBF6|nr:MULTISPECIES: hypothetical protein [unclassified Actinoplanes]AEV81535.1 Regulatory protein afsR [Actinoplanes sp. SE50/110]ATO79937.1 Regulatory protein afsR [Actinoplanes sp. SE50]SLL97339.1 Regulatory protein afsR [Actinoplanes sp. SE50/110]
MSTIEVLTSEAVRVIAPGVANAAEAGIRRLIDRFLKRGSRFPDDPAERRAYLRRLIEEDAEFRELLDDLVTTAGRNAVHVDEQPHYVDHADLRRRLAQPGVWLINGARESGKTALTRQVAVDMRDRLTGYAEIDLDEYRTGGVLRITEVQQRILRRLDVDEVAVTAADVDLQYRRFLRRGRCLVVLDNLVGAEEAEALAHIGPAGTVLITTRQLTPDLRAWYPGRPEPVEGVDPASARQILADRCGRGPLAAEPDAVDELIRLCDAYPALLRQFGGRLAIRGNVPDAVAEEVRWFRTDPGVEVLFANSVRRSAGLLGADSAAGLALLAGHPGTDLSDAGASAWLGYPSRDLIADLLDTSLITRDRSGRLSFPWSVRRYAATALRPGEETSNAAFHRYLTWFRDLAGAADLAMDPAGVTDRARDGRLRRYPAPPAITWPFPAVRPVDWLAAEAHNVEDLLREAHFRGHHAEVVQIAGALEALLTMRGRHWTCLRANESALASAAALGRTAAVIRLHIVQARILTLLGLLEQAGHEADRADAGIAGLADPQLTASLRETQARREQEIARRGDPAALDRAAALLRQSVDIDQAIGDRRALGLHLRMLANVLIEAGSGRDALDLLADVHLPAGDPRNAARVHTVRAKAWLSLGDAVEGRRDWARAVELTGLSGAGQYQGELLELQARLAELEGDRQTARDCLSRLAIHYARDKHPREQEFSRRLAALGD